MTQHTRPESEYAGTTDKAKRRRLQGEVVAEYRGHVLALAKKLVPASCLEDAEQAGLIGVLAALERYDASRCGGDRGAAFWNFARRFARDEIRDWRDRGLYWRPRTRKVRPGADEHLARVQRAQLGLDAPLSDNDEATMHDVVADPSPSVEEAVAEIESVEQLHAFAATLTAEERHVLLSEHGRCVGSRRHLSLVGRATAALRGSDARSTAPALRSNHDTVRP